MKRTVMQGQRILLRYGLQRDRELVVPKGVLRNPEQRLSRVVSTEQ